MISKLTDLFFSSKSSSSSSPAASLPPLHSMSTPFSLVEFGNLVALALETDLPDRVSEPFLQLDPEILRQTAAPTPTPESPSNLKKLSGFDLSSPAAVIHRSLRKMRSPSSSLNHHQPANTALTSAWTDSVNAPSRPRLILNKIKHKASALVLRTQVDVPEKDKTRSQAPTVQTISNKSTLSSRSSFFDDYSERVSETGTSSFSPYVPLAVQYERTATRKSSAAIFSRPASIVTAPPPSPTKSSTKSIRSFSTTSSAAPVTPTTDVFAPRPSKSSACSPDASFNTNTSRWSLSTDESMATTSNHSMLNFSYPNHPFASTHDVSNKDPFAKGHVQVIRNSASSNELAAYTQTYPTSPTSHKRRSYTRSSPSPIPGVASVPAPKAPLPSPPKSVSPKGTRQKQKVLRIRVTPESAASTGGNSPDWTLALPKGVVVPRSPVTPTSATGDAPPTPRTPTEARQTTNELRRRSFLSHTSDSEDDSQSIKTTSTRSKCPSAWHPSPPPSPQRPSLPLPNNTSKSLSGKKYRRTPTFPIPPRTADSTASTDSTATITPVLTQLMRDSKHLEDLEREKERERTLAVLNGYAGSSSSNSQVHLAIPTEEEAQQRVREERDIDTLSMDSGTYYSARSSFTAGSTTTTTTRSNSRNQSVRASWASAYGCSVPAQIPVRQRVRVDSDVRPVLGC